MKKWSPAETFGGAIFNYRSIRDGLRRGIGSAFLKR